MARICWGALLNPLLSLAGSKRAAPSEPTSPWRQLPARLAAASGPAALSRPGIGARTRAERSKRLQSCTNVGSACCLVYTCATRTAQCMHYSNTHLPGYLDKVLQHIAALSTTPGHNPRRTQPPTLTTCACTAHLAPCALALWSSHAAANPAAAHSRAAAHLQQLAARIILALNACAPPAALIHLPSARCKRCTRFPGPACPRSFCAKTNSPAESAEEIRSSWPRGFPSCASGSRATAPSPWSSRHDTCSPPQVRRPERAYERAVAHEPREGDHKPSAGVLQVHALLLRAHHAGNTE